LHGGLQVEQAFFEGVEVFFAFFDKEANDFFRSHGASSGDRVGGFAIAGGGLVSILGDG
jgi:hypothetical protein